MEELNLYCIPKIKLDKTPRPQQIKMLDFCKKSILDNNKFMLLDSPTGSGKSYFCVMFMDWFKNNYDRTATFDILTNSKILQEQYTNDFDFMNSLWGKQSYFCEKYNTDCGTGSEFCKLQNTKCDACPYKTAKYKFENGDIALTNFHLFLTYMVYIPAAWKRSSRVLIIDEAHDMDTVFSDFISTKISKPLLKYNGFTDDETNKALSYFKTDGSELTIDEFINILITEFIPLVKSVISRLNYEFTNDDNHESMKKLQSLSNNFLKWDSLEEQYKSLPSNWILNSEEIKKYNKDAKLIDSYIEYTAQPVWSYPYLDEMLWTKYDYVICMSGTILDKNIFSKMNGIDDDRTTYLSLDSDFPVENRPIFYFSNLGKQTYNSKDITWSKQKLVVEKIMKKHKNEKGIIHTVNYELQKWVEKDIKTDRILTHDSNNKIEILQAHYNTTEPTVLVSPSMTTGVDLKSEFSRHQTILKMPYPNLGSKKIQQRMKTMKEFYSITTIREIIQMYGRSVRSKDDYANTYILDACFSNILKYNRSYFPQWVLDAIKYIE